MGCWLLLCVCVVVCVCVSIVLRVRGALLACVFCMSVCIGVLGVVACLRGVVFACLCLCVIG